MILDMSLNTPLRFKPLFREYLWGGRRLETELNKRLGSAPRYAESWEIVDHGGDQSIVDDGPHAGQSLHELVTRYGPMLFGRHKRPSQFPLLFKFLDAHQVLSVQVHPNDVQAARLQPPDLGKTEAWVVLACDPGSKIYAGLKTGVSRAELQRALEHGVCETCLHEFNPSVGDCILVEAGTVHAISAGLLIAEIQQSSDTTFRLFDWNRLDRDGKPRPLHVEQALDVIDFSRGPVQPQSPRKTPRPYVDRLVRCDKFIVDRWRIDEMQQLATEECFHILAIVNGSVRLESANSVNDLQRGDTCLIPASCDVAQLAPSDGAEVLDIYLP
jgi:mannose-6-phosphate isomerase